MALKRIPFTAYCQTTKEVMRIELELKKNLTTGIVLIGAITAIVTLIRLFQRIGLDIELNLGFRNILIL
ncbi:MAG: hypothetical protein LUQ65_10570 [Candidatus Helarchaeota archaeon]|nr:hypothetical protein [Candidatus Helarchaeota archaeon]